MSIAIIIDKKYQIDSLKKVLSNLSASEKSKVTVYALRADVEIALNEQKIKFESGKKFRNIDYLTRMDFSEKIITKILSGSFARAWQIGDISLGDINRITIQDYLVQYLYWFDIIVALFDSTSFKKVIIFASPLVSDVTKALSNKKHSIVYDAVKQVANERHCEVVAVFGDSKKYARNKFIDLNRLFLSGAIASINTLITVLVPRKKTRLVISDSWRNTQPYLELLSDIEIIFWDKKEIVNVGWRNILRYRMRFMHADKYRTINTRENAEKISDQVVAAWQEHHLENTIVWKGKNISGVVHSALEELVLKTYSDALLVGDTYSMLRKIKPDAIIVRASASTQLHFPILCLVSKELSIPSVEPQHGLFYLGPSSVPKFSTSSVMATYGPLASRELSESGYRGTCVNVGSPRFDVYNKIKRSIRNNVTEPRLLVVLPDDTTGLWFDTYDIVEIVNLFASLDIFVVFKSRANAPAASFGIDLVNKNLSNKKVTLAITEPLNELFLEADIVVSVYSTILLEALAADIQVVYLATAPFHKQITPLHMGSYAGAIDVVSSVFELQQIILKFTEERTHKEQIRQSFLGSNFCVKEGSSERFAAILKKY